MADDIKSRIEAMYSRDRLFALGFVLVLWVTVLFVLLAVQPYIADPSIVAVCWIAAALLLLFNTTSILAMVRHYGHDKEHIYGTDIKHLDAGR
jgi:fatty acid desaturase